MINSLPCLEELSIKPAPGLGREFVMGEEMLSLQPKLKSLSLETVTISETVFATFLIGLQESLINLHLHGIKLTSVPKSVHDERWARLYTLLRDEFKMARAIISGVGEGCNINGAEDLYAQFSEGIRALEDVKLQREVEVMLEAER